MSVRIFTGVINCSIKRSSSSRNRQTLLLLHIE